MHATSASSPHIYLYKPVQIWALHLPLCCGSQHQGILLHVERLRNRFRILLQCVAVAGGSRHENEMNLFGHWYRFLFRMMHSTGEKGRWLCGVVQVQSLVPCLLGLLQLFLPKIFHPVNIHARSKCNNWPIILAIARNTRRMAVCEPSVTRVATATGKW